MKRFGGVFGVLVCLCALLVVGICDSSVEDVEYEDRRRPRPPSSGGGGGGSGGARPIPIGTGWRYRRRATPLVHPVVFCYWGSWSNLRPGIAAFGIQDMPLDLCTHIAYSFIGLTAKGELTFPEVYNVPGKSNSIDDFIALRQRNSSLNLMVALGGWNEGSENFSIVTNDDALRANLVKNLVNFMDEKGFNGLDVDWEYPGQRGGNETDKEAFIWLLRDLKREFEPKRWVLTASVAPTQYHIDQSYDVPALNRYVDYILLMTYDYHGTWSETTGANAPLFPQVTDEFDNGANVNASVYTWIAEGASRSKLILGMAAYGKTFQLTDLRQTSTGAPFDGPGIAGTFTQEPGLLSYLEICTDQRTRPDWSVTVVNKSYVYGHIDNQWVSYDNSHTIYYKGLYASFEDLAGMMFWTLDFEDFGGHCGENYGLIRNSIRGYRSSGNSLKVYNYLFVLLILITSIFPL